MYGHLRGTANLGKKHDEGVVRDISQCSRLCTLCTALLALHPMVRHDVSMHQIYEGFGGYNRSNFRSLASHQFGAQDHSGSPDVYLRGRCDTY